MFAGRPREPKPGSPRAEAEGRAKFDRTRALSMDGPSLVTLPLHLSLSPFLPLSLSLYLSFLISVLVSLPRSRLTSGESDCASV